MKAAVLPDRGIVRLTGPEARPYLSRIITADVEALAPGGARYGGLLSPQGKIVADFIVTEAGVDDGGGFYIDCPRALVRTLIERLGFYRLRARITIEDMSDRFAVMAVWNGTGASDYGLTYPDPRLPALGFRVILPPETTAEAAADLGAGLADVAEYESHRIALGVPRGGEDFLYGDTFPHEADMDQLHGIAFDKGCYIGQEVVSRVEHRASARSRVVPVTYDGPALLGGVAVLAGDKQIGMFGSGANGRGLALLRLDRAAEALANNIALTAGGVPIALVKPAWAKFPWPGEPGTA